MLVVLLRTVLEFFSHGHFCHLLYKLPWLSASLSKELQFGNPEPEKANIIFLP